MMGLFAFRKDDRELMRTKLKGVSDGRPALQMIQLVDSEDESVKPIQKKRLRRNFFKRREPIFSKFENETCSPRNDYEPPPAHLLFPNVSSAHPSVNNDKHKAITIAGTQSTDSSSTATGAHEYQPPGFRIAALQPSMSVEEVQRACSPSVKSGRRSSSSFVQFAFDTDFQRIEELNMFECGEKSPAPKDSNIKETTFDKTKALPKKKKAKMSFDFPIISVESLAMQESEFPKKSAASPAQSVVSLTNATVTGCDDEVPMTYTEDTNVTDAFVGAMDSGDFIDPFKIDALVSHGSNELMGMKWVEDLSSFNALQAASSQDGNSLIDSIRMPKKSSSWDLEIRKPKTVGTRDPSPRCIQPSSSVDHLFDQGVKFGVDAFPDGPAMAHVIKEPSTDFIFDAQLEERFGVSTFPENSNLTRIFYEPGSGFIFDHEMEGQFGADEFFEPSSAQPFNEIIINEQTNCIKGLPASAIAASMIFRQTIGVNEEQTSCRNQQVDDFDDFEDSESLHGRYFPDGTPMDVFADRQDAVTTISSLTEGASSFHKERSLDVWGRQAQNVINHWNFAAKRVREETTPPKKSAENFEGSAKRSVSDELMNMFSP